MAYWINSTLAAMPAVLWMMIGVGLPWALAILPRKDWVKRPLVVCAMLAFGPAWVTAWMFMLGTIGGAQKTAMMTAPNILIGTVMIALIGAVLAWRKRGTPFTAPSLPPLSIVERMIIGLIVVALMLRWLTAAYWPFVTYDPIWVYGYQGRLYSLLGYIPQDIGYYPQFVQLQYAYGQIMTGGVIDDHAARAGLMLWHLGSILAVYVLGERLFGRRTGIFAAGLWALYPHVGEWSMTGDLEIPLTFTFTAAAAFFLAGWVGETRRERLRYGLIAGLFFSIALWTKPTAGAFVWGVLLVLTIDLLRLRFDWRSWLPRFEVAFMTGLATIPLGGAWYIRNILLGHPPIDLPHPFWLTQALRSGQEFGWFLLALGLLVAFLLFAPIHKRPKRRMLFLGLALIGISLVPTILTPRRINEIEWVVFFGGLMVVGFTLWRDYAATLTPTVQRILSRVAWSQALALPYFITWFYSYSYHYRLSFPIVPLMLLPSAVILAHWVTRERVASWTPVRRLALAGLVLLIGLPGTVNTLYHYQGGWDWLWSGEYPTDFNRLETNNVALAWTVKNIQDTMERENLGEDTVIVAPGLQRLPFFFPLLEIRNKVAPDDLGEIADADFYIYSQEARWFYDENKLPEINQVTGSMQRGNVMAFIGGHLDSSFFSRIYRVLPSQRRFRAPRNVEPQAIVFSDFAQLVQINVSRETLDGEDYPAILRMNWKALHAADRDYSIYVHLRDTNGVPVTTWDNPPARGEFTYYATHLWETGEFVMENRPLPLPPDVPPGEYTLAIGFYDLWTNERVPVTINGEISDGYVYPIPLRVSSQRQ